VLTWTTLLALLAVLPEYSATPAKAAPASAPKVYVAPTDKLYHRRGRIPLKHLRSPNAMAGDEAKK
jgi:hypothetical protein